MTNNVECCRIDAVVTIDSKGQIILPKDIREKAKLKPNDKLAVIGCGEDDETCCIIMIKTEKLANTLKGFLGPMLQEVLR